MASSSGFAFAHILTYGDQWRDGSHIKPSAPAGLTHDKFLCEQLFMCSAGHTKVLSVQV